MIERVSALVHAWLTLDFFGHSRRSGEPGSSLTTAIFGQSFIGLLFALVTVPDPGDGASVVPFAAANLTLSALLMGIGVQDEATRRQRLRADEVLLRTAPVGRVWLALARVVHGGFALSLVTIGVAIPAAILSYWVAGGVWWVTPLYLLVAVWLSGLVAGGLWTLTAAVSTWFGAARGQLVGASAKGLVLGGGFVGFALCLPHLRGTADDLPFGRGGALAWPPYWAARWLADPAGGIRFAGLLALLSVVLFAAGSWFQRSVRNRSARVGAGVLSRVDRMIARDGPLLGIVAFTSAMLYRCAGFRAKVLPVLGLPAAMVGLSLWQASPDDRVLLIGITMQFPAIYLPLLVGFLPQADELRTSWVFAASPVNGRLDVIRHAALISLTTHVILPALAIAGLVLLVAGAGVTTSIALTSFSLGAAILAGGVVIRGLSRVPFSHETESVAVDPGPLFGSAFVLGIGGGLFSIVASTLAGLFWGLVLLGVGLRYLLRRPI